MFSKFGYIGSYMLNICSKIGNMFSDTTLISDEEMEYLLEEKINNGFITDAYKIQSDFQKIIPYNSPDYEFEGEEIDNDCF